MERLAKNMLEAIDKQSWERGLDYYFESAVADVNVSDTMVFGRVHGSTEYLVRLDLRSFRVQSYCSCPYERFCKHMVAVFFELYQEFGDPYEFLESHVAQDERPTRKFVQQSLDFGPDFDFSHSDGTFVSKRPSLGAPTKRKPWFPKPDDGLAAYIRHVEAMYANISRRFYQFGYYYDLRSEFLWPFYSVSQSWPMVKKQMYRLYVSCFLINVVFAAITENDDSVQVGGGRFRTDIASRLMQDCFREVVTICRETAHSEMLPAWLKDSTFWEIVDYLRTNIIESQSVNTAMVMAYQLVWSYIAQHGSTTNGEIERLQHALELIEEGSPADESIRMALVCLLTLVHRDDEALAMADTTTEESEESVAFNIKFIADSEEWLRVIPWLRFVSGRIERLSAENVRRFADLWLTARSHVPVDDECELFMRKGLPLTATHYEHYLYESNQLRKWVEVQMAKHAEPTEYRADFLKVIETTDRQALLPWYHQAIERAVRRKNRDAYKLAVRMLKKLGAHYKKLKKQEDWERFIESFAKRYVRFRALQEEMRKKGLIL